jgi:hypothetical protein
VVRLGAALAAVAMMAAACGGGSPATSRPTDVSTTAAPKVVESSPASSTSTTAPPPTPAAPATTTPTPPGVEVVVTGVLERNPDGTREICEYAAACFGIPVDDTVDPTLDGQWVRAVGTFDGRALSVADVAREPVVPFAPHDVTPRCPELGPGAAPSPESDEAVLRYLDSVSDVYAGAWLDETGVTTYAFVGDDVSAHRAAIIAAAGDAPVCVVGGARWSAAELRALTEQIFGTWMLERGVTMSGGTDDVDNVVDVHVRVLDGELREWLAQFGERVRLTSYIELVDAPRAALPPTVPVVPGDVALLTQRDGGRNGEQALTRFTLRYDDQLGCVYGELGDGRLLPVWPDGYTATADPLAVHDFDGVVVAVEGQGFESGAGYHDPATLARWSDGTDTCGVDGSDALVVITR